MLSLAYIFRRSTKTLPTSNLVSRSFHLITYSDMGVTNVDHMYHPICEETLKNQPYPLCRPARLIIMMTGHSPGSEV